MQCYYECTASTVVTHCALACLISSKRPNLVVVRTNILQVFDVVNCGSEKTESHSLNLFVPNRKTNLTSKFNLNSSKADITNSHASVKLVLRCEYTLSGLVSSISKVKIANGKSDGDALLVALKNAKLSLIEWDPEINSLSNISIHFYENDNVYHNPALPDVGDCQSVLAMDPDGRCAAYKFGVRNVAFIPFRLLKDDLVDDELDRDIVEQYEANAAKGKPDTSSCDTANNMPYMPSFVLPLTSLDSRLRNPIHLAFLYEYREPTFGVLFAPKQASLALLPERIDPICYAIFALDLEHRASTTLLFIHQLPYDLARVLPLKLPIGGALLIGNNEFIHVDQAGKMSGVAVNSFGKLNTEFVMSDQSSLQLRLEGCLVEPLGGDDLSLLIVLKNGNFALLSFKFDGRSVSGLSVNLIPSRCYEGIKIAAASCLSLICAGCMFIGSDCGDSVLIGWSRITTTPARRKIIMDGMVDDVFELSDEFDVDNEDDLYQTNDSKAKKPSEAIKVEEMMFYKLDELQSVGPMHNFTFRKNERCESESKLELIAVVGCGNAGALAFMNKSIILDCHFEFECPANAVGLWAIQADAVQLNGTIEKDKLNTPTSIEKSTNAYNGMQEGGHHKYFLVSHENPDGSDKSVFYQIDSGKVMKEVEQIGDFDLEAGLTVEICVLVQEKRIVQILKSEIRSYNLELELVQIMPIEDSDGRELEVASVSFVSPYLLTLLSNNSVVLFCVASNGDLEEVELTNAVKESKWQSACLYSSEFTKGRQTMFMLSTTGELRIYDAERNNSPLYVAESLAFTPLILSSGKTTRKGNLKNDLEELLMVDIGDKWISFPYLLLRSYLGDVIVYEPFYTGACDDTQPFTHNLQWQRMKSFLEYGCEPIKSENEEVKNSTNSRKFMAMHNLSGYNVVIVVGETWSRLIVREASSTLRILDLCMDNVVSMCKFHSKEFGGGIAYLNKHGKIKVGGLSEARYGDTGWAVRKVSLDCESQHICHHHEQKTIIIECARVEKFRLPVDDYHHEWAAETTDFLPEVEQSSLKLLDDENLEVIDSWEFEATEVVLCMEIVTLEVSEVTHRRKSLIAVGTGIVRGEDLAETGGIYIFEIIHIVPLPGRPKTNRKLKLLTQEKMKGAVSSVTEIGLKGFLLVVSGQKCTVRGLKEDGSLLPTAFMDLQCYNTVAKTLKGTGMLLLGDAVKGITFAGYTEEPYKMIIFGKYGEDLEIVSGEFLPVDKRLYMIAGDANGFLHVFEYAPEDPKSVSGHRLLQRSAFFTGHTFKCMKLLPVSHDIWEREREDYGMGSETETTKEEETEVNLTNGQVGVKRSKMVKFQILASTSSGAMVLITPADEWKYRRMYALQSNLTHSLEHCCALNPRAFRLVESDGLGSRGTLDGILLRRWEELGGMKRAECCTKIGYREWELRNDFQITIGYGLGYL